MEHSGALAEQQIVSFEVNRGIRRCLTGRGDDQSQSRARMSLAPGPAGAALVLLQMLWRTLVTAVRRVTFRLIIAVGNRIG